MSRHALALLLAVGLAGCSYPISEEFRVKAKGGPSFPAALDDPAAYKGATVIWGGEIIRTVNKKGGTDITVLEAPLRSSLMPGRAFHSRGRFIIRSRRFLDPAVYRTSKRVTVAGQIVSQEKQPLGEIQYGYPVLQVRELHLWPSEWEERADDRYYSHDPWWPRTRFHFGWHHWRRH